MSGFSDAQIGDLIDALDDFAVSEIQGFHYPPKFVIRDCLRKPGKQVIWEGPDNDDATFQRQCEIERTRVALALWLTKPAMQRLDRPRAALSEASRGQTEEG